MDAHLLAKAVSEGLAVATRLPGALVLAGALAAGPALAQVKKCEGLRAEIESRLSWPKGSYRLEIVPREDRSEGKFLGQCEAGSKKIMAVRSAGASDAPAAAEVVAAPAAAAPVNPARPTLPAPERTAVAGAPATPAPAPAPPSVPAPTAPQAAAPVASTAVPAPPPEPPPVAVAEAKPPAAEPASKVPADRRIRIDLKDRVEPGETTTLDIELDIGDAIRQLRKELAGRGESVATENVLVESVEARVVASKLDVTSADRNPQAVRSGIPAKWSFFLNPEEEGRKKVKVVLTVELGKGAPPYEIYTETRDLVVERSGWDEFMLFINKNLQWLAATVLVPLAGLWWKSRKSPSA